MTYTITLIPGDGIGPEVIESARAVIEATDLDIEWEVVDAGESAYRKYGTPLPKETVESIKRNKIALKGPLMTPIGTGYKSVNVTLRRIFNLYAIVRPVRYLEGLPTHYKGLDIVIIREGTEGLYSGAECYVSEKHDMAIALRIITRKACRRVVHFAFNYARKYERRKITLVHKANILKLTCGMLRDEFYKAAKEYPDIEVEDLLVDNMAMQLVLDPGHFDVILTSNMFGDILSDLAAGLVGTIGIVPSANIGDEYAIFEPTHGTAPQLAGKGIANPIATILAGALMLEYIGEVRAARLVREAVEQIVSEGKYVTFDIASKKRSTTYVGTRQMTEKIIEKMESLK